MSTFVRPKWTGFGRAVLIGAFVALFGGPSGVSGQDLADKYERNRARQLETPRARFSLHAEPAVVLQANQFQCGLRNQGDTCTDIFNSPTGGGGFWPTGSPNQYMFNSGIMIAGVIAADAGFEWAGDTTGAYFMDARGTQQHGTPITNIYNSLNPDDLANWPSAGSVPGFDFATAYIEDASIFNSVLLGRASGSQQDTWVMYWDGDPALSANRDHPMGIAIEQRTMAWNFPAGNEATIYIFYKITNVTDNDTFEQLNEQRFGIDLPADGWRIDSLYLAYDADPDVTTDAGENFASVILPFNMGITYHATFTAPEFSYPPSLFFPPFFTAAPGIVGVQYLKSPANLATADPDDEVGLTMFSVHENPGSCNGLCDPLGDKQLWRYISGNVRPGLGDPACTYPDPQASRICYLPQSPADARFFQASGPFSLDAGQSATIVVAMMAAATVNTPDIFIGSENPPGAPTLAPGCGEAILPIEVGAGWINTPPAACPTEEGQSIDLRDVNVVPSSLLGRGQVAQAVFDEQFLLPFAPEPPPFHLVPGDGEIVIIWGESLTETAGDPFFAAAQDTESALFNPNYREFDVEGYRIYKSTDNSNFDLIAQFDYEGTTFTDVLCEADRGYVPGEDPACTTTTEIAINDITDINADFIEDPFVLFGGADAQRLRLADGRTLAVRGDSASAGTLPDLSDTGVPFAFIDTDVRNGFRYFYQVRAFDINSTFSGPVSLESSSATKNAVPQAASPNQVVASFTQTLQGAGGTALDPTAPMPGIDAETGIFDGPMPPTNGVSATFAPLVPRLLPQFTLTARIDSIKPGPQAGVDCTGGSAAQLGICWNMYMTYDFSGNVSNPVIAGFTPTWDAFGEVNLTEFQLGFIAVPADAASLEEFGAPEGFVSMNAALVGQFDENIHYAANETQSNRRIGSSGIPSGIYANGPRWFSGANETVADPARWVRVGAVDAADTVWAPIGYTPVGRTGADVAATGFYTGSGTMQYLGYTLSMLQRVADIEVRWNGGEVEVWDVTHDVPVPFKSNAQQSFGFFGDFNGNGVIDWRDFMYSEGAAPVLSAFVAGLTPTSPLSQSPIVLPTSTQGFNAEADFTATGTGIGLWLNAQPWIFELPGGNLPPDGTVWTLRSYKGYVRASAGSHGTADPTSYTYSAQIGGQGPEQNNSSANLQPIRQPMVPGLEVVFESVERTQLVGAPDLTLIHTIPDPYYAQSRYDLSPVERALRFVNLPSQATIRIYTVSGLLVDIINHNDPAGGGLNTWDLRNRSGQFVASGVYFYHVSTPDGQEHIGRFTVINSGIGQ